MLSKKGKITVVCFIGLAVIMGVVIIPWVTSKSIPLSQFNNMMTYNHSDLGFGPVNSTNNTSNQNQTSKIQSWIIENGQNKTILYVYPIMVSKQPLTPQNFKSQILSTEQNGSSILIKLDNQMTLKTNDTSVTPKDFVNGTTQSFQPVCSDLLVFGNGSRLAEPNFGLLSTNQFYFKNISGDPYCQPGVKGLEILDWNIIK